MPFICSSVTTVPAEAHPIPAGSQNFVRPPEPTRQSRPIIAPAKSRDSIPVSQKRAVRPAEGRRIMTDPISDSPAENALIVYFRLTMAWTFLNAASHQVFVPGWSVVGFLDHTKTFHDLFAVFATPTIAPITTFLVEYGHLLIGLSLLTGLLVRVSAAFGILLMIVYWMAHMDWPFIENSNNFIVDYHLVYAGVMAYLIVKHAGHVWGLDAWFERTSFVREHPGLRPLFA